MIKKIFFISILSISYIFASNIQDPKLDQFIEKLKKLSEEKEKMNPYQFKEVKSEPTIQDKMRQEQIIHQYIEMKQKYDPKILSDKIDIAINSLKSIKRHDSYFDNIYIPFYNSYKAGKKQYVYIDKNELDKIVKYYKNLYKKRGVIDSLIDRLVELKKGINKNKSLIIDKDLQFIVKQIDDIYQNNRMLLNNRQPNNPIIDNSKKELVKLYIGQKLPEGIKVKKTENNTVLIGY